ncbi:MAG: NUDIX hydrolase [Planctomycetota bacterium]|jgi:8-oxo-dGTP pyrophosphatase MutT (NUDIX family)|nr:NUDIX hydrolase [Planctomycetota bacterium]
MDDSTALPRVNASRDLLVGRYLSFRQLAWTDTHGVDRLWEAADRIPGFRAVMIIPRLFPSGRLAVIRQYRPPARGWVMEFPAGILEEGEEVESGARRELREETGLVAERLRLWPPAFTSPGLTNETVYVAEAEVEEEREENRHPRTEFDSSEQIETLLLTPDELVAFYNRESAKGVFFDGRLVTYILSRTSATGQT